MRIAPVIGTVFGKCGFRLERARQNDLKNMFELASVGNCLNSSNALK